MLFELYLMIFVFNIFCKKSLYWKKRSLETYRTSFVYQQQCVIQEKTCNPSTGTIISPPPATTTPLEIPDKLAQCLLRNSLAFEPPIFLWAWLHRYFLEVHNVYFLSGKWIY